MGIGDGVWKELDRWVGLPIHHCVAGAGSMGGVVEIVGDEDGEESSDDKVEVINEPPSAAAHPAPDTLERVTDTVSFRHF